MLAQLDAENVIINGGSGGSIGGGVEKNDDERSSIDVQKDDESELSTAPILDSTI